MALNITFEFIYLFLFLPNLRAMDREFLLNFCVQSYNPKAYTSIFIDRFNFCIMVSFFFQVIFLMLTQFV